MERAYRRPTEGIEVKQAVTQFTQARTEGLSYEGAIKQVLQTVLISPKFLLRVEAGQDGRESYPVSDFELASRLSYFLWATMPDQELFDLAKEGKLSDQTEPSFSYVG